MNDLIEKRNERTRKRKKAKRKMDSIIGLSFHGEDKQVMSLTIEPKKLSDSKARLIDEGYIDNGFVIKKGTLEKYLNGENQYVRGYEFDGEEWHQTEVLNLTSDFVGTVNLGHMDFSVMPYILGEWTKDDLTLVDIENDRKALDVTLHLDEESVFVKELKRQSHDIGISAEFWVHENEEDTEALSETLGYYLPVFDEIYIFAYGLVGECGNVNSSGLELKGEPMEDVKDIILDEPKDEKEELGVEEVEIPTEEPTVEEDSVVEESEDTESAEAEVTEEAEEAESEESTEGEEVADEETAEEDGDEVEDDEAEEIEDADEEELAIVTELKEQIQTLTNRINELAEANKNLKKTNKRLSAKYQNELDKKQKFKDSLKGLSVELLPDEDKKPTEEKVKVLDKNYVKDGIGEL
ncbi:MAG: hypothetical protein U0L88_08230 [Acutalibacteraceae bacterium]|nr:hypothetical protein [Acutalibacteraceae bacterium]